MYSDISWAHIGFICDAVWIGIYVHLKITRKNKR